MSYAHNFKFLCDLAGIPCILVHSDVHQWNRVYISGAWWNVDVSALDVGDDVARRGYQQMFIVRLRIFTRQICCAFSPVRYRLTVLIIIRIINICIIGMQQVSMVRN